MPMTGGFSSSKPPLARLMAFIDGGYLREQCLNKIKTDEINYEQLKITLELEFNANCGGKYSGDLIRIFYYDAIVDHSEPEFIQQNEKFSKIKNYNGYEVRLGRLVKTGGNKNEKFKQKGVDVKLAVDMISKAYQDQYDFALLIAGDNDFLDVVESVKDSGKRVFGLYFREHIAKDLYDSLDAKMAIDNFVNKLKFSD